MDGPDFGDLTEELLQSWVHQFGAIFTFQHLDQLYVYRRLTRRELRAINQEQDDLVRTEQVADTCILFPLKFRSINYMDSPAGILECVVEEILKNSGVGDPMETLARHQAHTNNNVEAQMEAMIEHVFGGGGNFDRFMDMSPDQFYEAYSRAELIAAQVLKIDLQVQKAGQTQQPRTNKKRMPQPLNEKQQQGKTASPSVQKLDADKLAILDEVSAPTKMAEAPMTEILRLQKINERKRAMKKLFAEVPYKPPEKAA